MSSTSNILPGIVMCGLSQEKAFDIVAELSEVQKNEQDNVTVYSGVHELHGAVHIIVTAIGDPIMLPIIVQAVGGSESLQKPVKSPLYIPQESPLHTRERDV